MNSKYDKIQKILDTYRQQLPKASPEWPYDVNRAIKYVHKNLFEQRLTVNTIKKECKLNGKSFSSRFMLCLGHHPKDYILLHRIEAGKKLLNYNGLTVTTAALFLGFNSLSSFCHTFKNWEGVCPSAWCG